MTATLDRSMRELNENELSQVSGGLCEFSEEDWANAGQVIGTGIGAAVGVWAGGLWGGIAGGIAGSYWGIQSGTWARGYFCS